MSIRRPPDDQRQLALPLDRKPRRRKAVPPTPDPEPTLPEGHALDLGMAALAITAAKNEDMILALIPVALRLAHEQGEVTTADLRREAVRTGLLTAENGGRGSLCYLGAVMRRAGLVNTGRLIRNPLNVSHGRHLAVWTRAPD